jgi:hypothetical protein
MASVHIYPNLVNRNNHSISERSRHEGDVEFYIKDVTTKLPLYFEEFNHEQEIIFTSDFSKAYIFDSWIETASCWYRIINELPLYRNKLNINWREKS